MTDHLQGTFTVIENCQGKPGNGDTRKQRLTELAQFCLGIIPTTIVGEADWQDAAALNDDMLLLAQKVDRVFQAYGDYVDNVVGGLSVEDRRLFERPTQGAIEGDATYVIESAVEVRQEALADNDGSDEAWDEQRTW